MEKKYNKIIIGAGLYGLYAAIYCAKRGEDIAVIEYDGAPLKRATHSNQARIHMGYHYPRSFSTAIKSAKYFNQFNDDFGFCIQKDFDKIYAISKDFSWTNAEQFKKFCDAAGIRCEEISVKRFFNDKTCEGAFLTEEYSYDANILREYFNREIEKYSNINIYYNTRIKKAVRKENHYFIETHCDRKLLSPFILNATYASINQILHLFGFDPFPIKYELCELIICEVNEQLKNVGITVMDGPFFSIMPFGKSNHHSLTSVTFTPHKASYTTLPFLDCQNNNKEYCNHTQLGNCDFCNTKPKTAWPYMNALARKYLKPDYDLNYKESLFSIKPILRASEIDDSRPTIIKYSSEDPIFISVLSGKINTVYDLKEVLQ